MTAVAVQLGTKQPVRFERLCEPCQNISVEVLKRALGSHETTKIASDLTYGEHKYSAREGCPLCQLFVDELVYIGRLMAVNMGSSVERPEENVLSFNFRLQDISSMWVECANRGTFLEIYSRHRMHSALSNYGLTNTNTMNS